MTVDYYWILAGVINLILFLLHCKAYKPVGYSLRKSWAAGTIGMGHGHASFLMTATYLVTLTPEDALRIKQGVDFDN